MVKMKTTEDMGEINTLLANCNRNCHLASSEKCSNSMDGFEMQNYEF